MEIRAQRDEMAFPRPNGYLKKNEGWTFGYLGLVLFSIINTDSYIRRYIKIAYYSLHLNIHVLKIKLLKIIELCSCRERGNMKCIGF